MSIEVQFVTVKFAEYSGYLRTRLDSNILINESKDLPTQATFDILVHNSPTPDWLKISPNLRAVIIPWAGISKETLETMSHHPEISLHNLHHNNYNTAELGFALLLAAAKNVIPMDQALRKNDWQPRYQPTKAVLLRDKTVLILGYGEIGKALGAYCLGVGMRVLASKRHTSPNDVHHDQNIEVFPSTDLHELLPSADILLIALPLTSETLNLIDKDEIMLMPKGSILINVGRGPIVNQFALYDALKTGHLRAAGSDVWYNYPETKEARVNTAPADVPFGELDNFVLSPHRGGMVEDVEKQRAEALSRLLNAANRGEKIPNQVNINAGY